MVKLPQTGLASPKLCVHLRPGNVTRDGVFVDVNSKMWPSWKGGPEAWRPSMGLDHQPRIPKMATMGGLRSKSNLLGWDSRLCCHSSHRKLTWLLQGTPDSGKATHMEMQRGCSLGPGRLCLSCSTTAARLEDRGCPVSQSRQGRNPFFLSSLWDGVPQSTAPRGKGNACHPLVTVSITNTRPKQSPPCQAFPARHRDARPATQGPSCISWEPLA